MNHHLFTLVVVFGTVGWVLGGGFDDSLLAGDDCQDGGHGVSCAFSALQQRAKSWVADQEWSDEVRPGMKKAVKTQPGKDVKALTISDDGAYITNAEGTQVFAWGAPTRTAEASWNDAFPGNYGWSNVQFAEQKAGSGSWTREAVLAWVKTELLGGPDPFAAQGGQVPVPWPAAPGDDQLGPGQYVAYSRRQVCFITAKSLLGSQTLGYNNGLLRFMEIAQRPARKGDFGRAWWLLLAACAADPSLQGGAQGPRLLAAKAAASPDVSVVRNASEAAPLSGADLRVCRYGDGGRSSLAGLSSVPPAGCASPGSGPGKDFMTGGLQGQATQDISAAWLGGYVFGNADGLGGGQDERLMVYFPEVSALAFFLSQSPSSSPQLRQPAWILGARPMGLGIDGTCRFDRPVNPNAALPMTSDLIDVTLGGQNFTMSSSRPFVAFMSESQGFLPASRGLYWARMNREPMQRAVNGQYAFANQVRAWYRSLALTSYAQDVQPILKMMVQSVGTGPWLAGLWFGDSQLGLLASWLGQAIAAPTWGGNFPLDYYIYSAFTENPGNQCFVHSAQNCAACLQACVQNPITKISYWLPDAAYMDRSGNPCVLGGAQYCGQKGIEDLVASYASKTAQELWNDLEAALARSGAQTPAASTVFDLMLNGR